MKYEHLIKQLSDKGYDALYTSIRDADNYYDTDVKIYCMQCREILDNFIAIIEEIIHIEHTNDDEYTRINNLSKRDEIDRELVRELTNMRIKSNYYHHYTDYKDRLDPDKDRRTFRTAIIKITNKILELPKKYDDIQQKKAEEDAKRKKRRQKWAVAGGVGTVLGILVFILKLLAGGSKRD